MPALTRLLATLNPSIAVVDTWRVGTSNTLAHQSRVVTEALYTSMARVTSEALEVIECRSVSR
jgi:hypothetical protein